jgi:tetratricopeptide (TPR) repeat protein
MSDKTENLRGMYLLIGLVCLTGALTALLVVLDTLQTWDVRTAYAILVLGSIGAWLSIKKARSIPLPQVEESWSSTDEEDAQIQEMTGTLEKLGIPLSFSVSNPETALTYGLVKGNIFAAHKYLAAGRLDEAIATLDQVNDAVPDRDSPDMSKALGVTFFLKGQALEKKGLSAEAAVAYRQALTIIRSTKEHARPWID